MAGICLAENSVSETMDKRSSYRLNHRQQKHRTNSGGLTLNIPKFSAVHPCAFFPGTKMLRWESLQSQRGEAQGREKQEALRTNDSDCIR